MLTRAGWGCRCDGETPAADVPDLVGGSIGVPVGVALEAGHAARRQLAAAVLGLVELLLGKRGDEQAQTLEVLRIQNPLNSS